MIIREQTVVGVGGEIITSNRETIKKINPDEYCMLFFKDNREIFKLTGAQLRVLLSCLESSIYISEGMIDEYPGNVIFLNSSFRKSIKEKTDMPMSTVYNVLGVLVKKGFLLKDESCRGTYYLNPKYFFKGTINSRTKLIENTIRHIPESEYNELLEKVKNNPEYEVISN